MAAIFTEPHRVDRFQLVMCFASLACAALWFLDGSFWLGLFWAAVSILRAGMSWKRR